MQKLAQYEPRAYAALRAVAGFLFMWHGVQKVFGVLGKTAPPLFSQMGLGGVIELTTGILIMLGLFTRWAAFLASGTMAVAYFQFHWKFQLGAAILPVINRGELAALYAFVFLLIAARGAGMWSLDKDKA